MGKTYEGTSPESAVLATLHRHVTHLRSALFVVCRELEHRGLVHDDSKYSSEEFPGFARINATAREHEYGSDEYRAALASERPTIERHTTTNTHHPEAHDPVATMGWLDIIEMVCDWWAATRTYGTTEWEKSVKIGLGRWEWEPEQRWLIHQVADFLPVRLAREIKEAE